MANPEHLDVLRQGVDHWNRWREQHRDIRPDLSQAEFSGASLPLVDLRGANLVGANLSGALLTQAVLIEADLSATDLSMADLSGITVLGRADLSEANLSSANLNQAYLGGTRFRATNLRGTDFTEAVAWETAFADVDLSVTKGLETVRHPGPSTVGIDTIYKSHGKIPEVFLRGCGLPDEFVAYIGSMVGRPLEFYSCFISYSTEDQDFADRLYNDLQGNGVRCWFAPNDMKGGRKIHQQIDDAIRVHDKLLLILSENSMNSNWVRTEIANARAREEREKKQMLFPITVAPFDEIRRWSLVDSDRGIDSAREIREYFIPDFSDWKDHGSYQKAFARLVKDLKAARQD
jgi:TIR domain/Pentapeptide repeats (8 copies)